MLNEPSERTMRRARKNPRNTNVKSLFALAKEQHKSMEEIAHLPLFLYDRRIDGYVFWQGYIFLYRKKLPKIPPRNSYYVYVKNGEIQVDRRDYIRTYEKLLGICVFILKVLPADDKQKEKPRFNGDLTEFTRCEENMEKEA